MNSTASQPQPQPQQQPHPPSTSHCPRHPQEQFTGFCPLCLCERLSVLDPNTSSSSSRKPPTATSALKSIFKPTTTSFLPELRRTKSFSSSKNNDSFLSSIFEPQRKSCDVRSTLSNLFTQDTHTKEASSQVEFQPSSSTLQVTESNPEEEKEGEEEAVVVEEENREKDEIEVVEDSVKEILEEEEEEEELKTMKDHIDLHSSHSKKASSETGGSFWSAASVFSKKLQKWRHNQKQKKRRNNNNAAGDDGGSSGTAALPVEKPIGRQFRDTQSEIADYGLGRRSCDTDPRFSLDIGRMSFDDPRYSMDEPRASWDGYLIGGRTAIPRMPTMLSVVEDAPVNVMRTDTQIPVEEPLNSNNNNNNLDNFVPGGSSQTKEYYSDSRRRKSLDRSNSIRKTAAAVVAEINELKIENGNSSANAKVTPASVDYVHGSKLGFIDRDLRHSNSMRERDDCCSESFDMSFRDTASVIGNGDSKGSKKSRRWGKGWSIWGLINRRGGSKDEDDDRCSRANGVENYGDGGGGGFNGRMFMRSNSSVSWRNGQGLGGGSFGTLRRNGVQANGNGKKAKDEFVLERNRSARYSSPNNNNNNMDNGLLQFYCRRNGSVKSRSNQAHSIARSVLRLY